MSEMVERVARAIEVALDNSNIRDDGLTASAGMAAARAAIEAMRKPTAGIIIAIAASLVCWEEVTPGEVWDSVLDAALK
jgi:hypothetical protein